MALTVSALVERVRNYCTSHSQIPSDQVYLVAKDILSSLVDAAPQAKGLVVQAFSREFANKTLDSSRVEFLKKTLREILKTFNWKEALLDVHSKDVLDLHTLFLKYSNALNHPLDTNRIRFFSGGDILAMFGSTFATNKPHRLDDKGHHLLDAAFAFSCFDAQGYFTGFSLALGDGSGGHFGDLKQDKMIARAAHFATKSCARLLSSYQNPDNLQSELANVINLVKEEVQRKASGESTTLIGCRAFPIPEGFRIVGFNLGDNMLIAWHPHTQKAYHLLPSHASEAGTALLPDAYRSFEIQILDSVLPEGSLLFLMSDGVHDTLPFTEQEKTYSNGLHYRVRSLTSLETILRAISPTSSPEVYLRILVQKSIEGAETLRQSQTNPDVQIGDDLSILQCHLRKPGLFERIKNRWI